MNRRVISNILGLTGLLVLLCLVWLQAGDISTTHAAGIWYVATTGSDQNTCDDPVQPCASIQAVFAKVGFVAGDTIRVGMGNFTSTSSPVLLITKDVFITGGWNAAFDAQVGYSTLNGENNKQVLINQAVATVDRVNIVNGYSAANAGGVTNSKELTLDHCMISDNVSAVGGGIFCDGFTQIKVLNSAIVNNRAEAYGGGVNLEGYTSAEFTNVTISGNHSPGGNAGGLRLWTGAVAYLNNVTLTSNTATYGCTAMANGGSVLSRNSIIAKNPGNECCGPVVSAGYSLIGSTTNCPYTAGPGDIVNSDPNLFPVLVGSPAYHPFARSSPAIDTGNPAGCADQIGNLLPTDQRGVARLGRCDIGAYEYDPSEDPLSYTILPYLDHRCDPLYTDDFSNPSSGWPVADSVNFKVEYLSGEYRTLIRSTNYGVIVRPGFQASDYVISVDTRNPGYIFGSYGIAFGIAQDFSSFYTFEIYPDGWFGLYRFNPSSITVLAEAYSPSILQGIATNHIKLVRSGTSIAAYANGQLLASVVDGTYSGMRFVGLIGFSYDQANVDIRFDNYLVYPTMCIGFTSPQTVYDRDGAGIVGFNRSLFEQQTRRP